MNDDVNSMHTWIVETLKGNLVKNYRREFDNRKYAEETYHELCKHGPCCITHKIKKVS